MAWDLRGCDMARKATWQHHANQGERLRGADAWQGHASPRRRSGGAYLARDVTGLANDGPTGIVGPGYSIGTLTHLRYIALSFIRAFFAYFFGVGLCSL